MKKRILFVLVFIFALTATSGIYVTNPRVIPTSGGNRNVTLVEIPLNHNYAVLGLAAQELLGRPTGTLSEFAAAMAHISGSDTIIFAGNFFVIATNEIIGAIYSQHTIVSAQPQPWLDHGVGFSPTNEFSLFRGQLLEGRIMNNTWIMGVGYSHMSQFSTAFNTHPHLIGNGQRLALTPSPAATQAWLDSRVQRAFMGQRADGTFIIGNITGANMREVQDVAAYLNLVNATNIDGGASAGIWRNGQYITRPGRQLPSVIFITNNPALRVVRVEINGTLQTFEVAPRIINDRTMLPLRAIAESLGMYVTFNDNTNTATLTSPGFHITHQINTNQITINGIVSQFDVPSVIVEDRTLVPVRMLAEAIGAEVDWDEFSRTVFIER